MEKDIERRLRKAVEDAGGLCLKFTSPGMDGVPDRVVILPTGLVCFVELKVPGGLLRPIQEATQTKMRQAGARVYTLYGDEDVDAFLMRYLPFWRPAT